MKRFIEIKKVISDEVPFDEMCKDNIITKSRNLFDLYIPNLLNEKTSKDPCFKARFNDFDEMMKEEHGLDSV